MHVFRFLERRPGYGLAVASLVATGVSTILSLWWPFPAEEGTGLLNMTGLRGSLTVRCCQGNSLVQRGAFPIYGICTSVF